MLRQREESDGERKDEEKRDGERRGVYRAIELS